MRIVWKDSGKSPEYKPIKYRKHFICGTPKGWATDIAGDNNLYKNHYCAKNAIDKALGSVPADIEQKRKRYGIQIVGKKTDETA